MISEYRFDRLILGGSLESLLYCYFNNEKLLVTNKHYPFELSTIEYCDSLRYVGYNKDEVIHKAELWDRLSFIMSLVGQIIMPNIITNFREESNKITTVTSRNKRIVFVADEIIDFDEDKDFVRVYDWFNVRSGNNHQHDLLTDKDNDFVKYIHFYKATRIGGNKQMKDLVAESIMHDKETLDVDSSEGIARLKVLRMMKDAGIRGQSNGYNANGLRLHYALKVEHTHRDIKKDYNCMHTVGDILQTEFIGGAQWNLTKKLFRHKQITTLQESYRLPANL